MRHRESTLKSEKARKTILSVVLALICFIYILPIFVVLMNSFKRCRINTIHTSNKVEITYPVVKNNVYVLPEHY